MIKKGDKKNDKKKFTIPLIILLILIIIIGVVAYFLIFQKGKTYFGFTVPDFSKGTNLGDVIGGLLDLNPWEETKLNPFGNESP